MRLNKDVELIEGLPLAYIKSLRAIVASDLHLGYESHMAKNGVFLPKVNLKKILSEFEKGVEGRKVEKIIIVGDIKNDFSNVEIDEFNELYEIIKFCKEHGIELILIKGNHDNFIDRYKESFKIKIYSDHAAIGDYLFAHGDKLPEISGKPTMLITGHEHPAIGIVNSIGRTEKLRCFLSGRYDKVDLLVFPAVSYFASGSDINIAPKEHLLSPILKQIDIDKMHAIAFGYGSTIDFGTIAQLRKLAKSRFE